MTSPPQGLYLPRRDSSPRPQGARSSSSSRRPRLLRACATEPSITTSSACKGVMTSPNSSRRATELLSRVAVSNAAASTMLGSSPSSTRSFGTDSSGRATGHLDEAAHRELLHGRDYSACYFSFPSFDDWEGEQPEGEKSYDASV